MSASSRTPPITDSTKDLLSSVGGVLAGAITAYIGGYISVMRRSQEQPPQADDSQAGGDERGPQGLGAAGQEGRDSEDDEGNEEADVSGR